jgi:hypothetical protein
LKEENVMTDREKMIKYDAKWAYWINPKTLRLSRLKTQVPIESIVLTKTHELSDDGRVFIVTIYGVATDEGVIRINKDKASNILAQQVIKYMKKKNTWPPFTSIKEVYKNGNVDVSYTPSEYDKFILKFTKQLVGADAQEYLTSLKRDESTGLTWIVEPAKSSRAVCRTCTNKIDTGQLRLGEPYMYEDKVSYKWHHPNCVARRVITLLLSELEGYEELSKAQKEDFVKMILSTK